MGILHIYSPDDSREVTTLNFKILDNAGQELGGGNYTADPRRYRSVSDPITEAILETIPHVLQIPGRRWYGDTNQWSRTLIVNDFAVLIEKDNTRYRANGTIYSKSAIMRALAKVMYRASYNASISNLFTTLHKNLSIPDNVIYALENRAPYFWYDKGQGIRVSLNVQMISPTECALEISDGIWADISSKDLNTFLNYYRHGKKRGSWKNLSPRRLWSKLMGEEPTEGQLKVMKAFLEQNRTKDIVEKRAQELMKDLCEQYPQRIKMEERGGQTWMYVRGKIADWVLRDKGMKGGIQDVSTYVFLQEEAAPSGAILLQDGHLLGPICIDNMTTGSSVGDQFAARAIALMNDVITVNRVDTIKRYIQNMEEDQQRNRFDWNELCRVQGE